MAVDAGRFGIARFAAHCGDDDDVTRVELSENVDSPAVQVNGSSDEETTRLDVSGEEQLEMESGEQNENTEDEVNEEVQSQTQQIEHVEEISRKIIDNEEENEGEEIQLADNNERVISLPPQIEITRPVCGQVEEACTQLVVSAPHPPTPKELSRVINDNGDQIEELFKGILRGISKSKLGLVKSGTNASTILEVDEEDENADVSEQESALVLANGGSPDFKSPSRMLELVNNLDYFIEVVCRLKSSDANDTYNIIVLYEKLIFDLKSEISSLGKSLKIYQTVLSGKEKSARYR